MSTATPARHGEDAEAAPETYPSSGRFVGMVVRFALLSLAERLPARIGRRLRAGLMKTAHRPAD